MSQFTHADFIVRLAQANDAQRLLDFRLRNREHLTPFEPKRHESHYQLLLVQMYLEQLVQNMKEKKSVNFVILTPDERQLIGTFNFANIVPHPFNACYLGYALDKDYQGKGVMTQALQHGIDVMFNDKKLHRIMANYIPENQKSGRVLERLGFEKEGYAKNYLEINGKWQDRILTALTNSDSMGF